MSFHFSLFIAVVTIITYLIMQNAKKKYPQRKITLKKNINIHFLKIILFIYLTMSIH
jgi:hypothetical protein